MKSFASSLLVLVVLASWHPAAEAQPSLPAPVLSPKASVTQTVGITDITVTFYRPGVKNRQIWGKLVSYDEVWRAGANANTTISFSSPVRVEGQRLQEGTYGLHMIPTPGEWTVIFSKNSTAWGSYFYDPSEDALRVKVKPVEAPHQEWLLYRFDDLTDSSATLSLAWERLRVPIRVTTDVHAIVLANARNSYLRGPAAFTWQGWNQAAAYCLRNNINLDEGLGWADRSISMNENFTNLRVKAGLLEKLGRAKEAEEFQKRALALATESDLNTLGNQYLQNNRVKDAVEIFERNVREHPGSWSALASLAEAYERSERSREAIKTYRKALDLVRDETQRKRLEEGLRRLQAQ